MIVLGIETSCDETAAAVLDGGRKILSSVVASQDDVHAPYGGVVPELASRRHLEVILPVIRRALETAGMGLDDVDGIAVTQGPGLVGSLLVGCSAAKAVAYARHKPLVGVNHLEGHLYAAFLEGHPPVYPFLALVVSGGHTALYLARKQGRYERIGQTRDDAAGEAFDKVAKLLGLGYPGGPVIERLAQQGNPHAIKFSLPRMGDGSPDFSFSGLKTAVTKYVRETGLATVANGEEPSSQLKDLAASFQSVVVRSLVGTMERVAGQQRPDTLIVAGGVACNGALRAASMEVATRLGIPVYFPSAHLSTDNAAMIAAAGTVKLRAGERAGLDLNADVTLRLQNIDVEDDKLRRAGV